ncbi:hypothetical protein FEK33_12400 [Nocardia asteroides NBRC 15531]|uniref:Ricin B lectin domain-containing protein n=1 Tax=Nocardia asteroides NBRC 15531 TaxID=1110697 RepID=U5EFX5_NOCAS|nr:hypothetical protein [Nocardia asteroides]TLF66825.1 hypothetical protein FEK33_12400 [Nocardia asteroides NBRC 15531]UGT51930.1 hypothetical protein LT345_15805 [Nocardia asteroides]SFN02078.1 hypothetical protein SAMN05444423_105383 [Nocardia asteroides]VEG35155.1 Uncharacterised protein [Nocardia asteroides]GAD85296.1 hypothetical protein NCAST_30_00660 [Nocardia asteroides NBRC 15531]
MYSPVFAAIAVAILCSPAASPNIASAGFAPVYIGPFASEDECTTASHGVGIRIPKDENGNDGLALIPECVLQADQQWYLKT